MDELNELRESVQAREEHKANQSVREYNEAIGDIPAKLEQELADLTKVGVEMAPVALKVLEKYPDNESDPPALRKAIRDLRGICHGALQTCKDNPGRITQLLARIQGRTPADFRSWSPDALGREDRIVANSLLGRAKALEALPQEIERVEKPVLDLVAVLGPRKKQGQGHQLPAAPRGAFNRQPEDKPPHIKPDFDPRSS